MHEWYSSPQFVPYIYLDTFQFVSGNWHVVRMRENRSNHFTITTASVTNTQERCLEISNDRLGSDIAVNIHQVHPTILGKHQAGCHFGSGVCGPTFGEPQVFHQPIRND